jgi:hypothetical protein
MVNNMYSLDYESIVQSQGFSFGLMFCMGMALMYMVLEVLANIGSQANWYLRSDKRLPQCDCCGRFVKRDKVRHVRPWGEEMWICDRCSRKHTFDIACQKALDFKAYDYDNLDGGEQKWSMHEKR